MRRLTPAVGLVAAVLALFGAYWIIGIALANAPHPPDDVTPIGGIR